MAERKVYDCDRCEKKDVKIKTLQVDIDRRMDAAGSSEDWTESIDLCIDCLGYALSRLTKKMSHADGKKFLKDIAGKNWHHFWDWS